jgi:hypothetical protein
MADPPTIFERPRPALPPKHSSVGGHLSWIHLAGLAIAGLALLAAALVSIAGIVEKWLWMRQLGFVDIFWTLLAVRWAMFCSAFVLAFLYLWLNFRQATRNSASSGMVGAPGGPAFLSGAGDLGQFGVDISLRLFKLAIVLASVLIAWIFAVGLRGQWDTYLRFRYGGQFGVSDPLFGVDVGFYVFHLPFYELLQTTLVLLTIAALAGAVFIYLLFGLFRAGGRREIDAGRKARSHLSALLFILIADWGWGLYLDHYNLVYSTLGVVHGAGYAADHVTRIALWIMVGVSALACGLLVVNFFRPRFGALVAGAGLYVAIYAIAVLLLPGVFQEFVVQPSELALETPYLKNYIAFTRKAYQLDAIQETSYPALADLTPATIARNEDTIENIRLWDSRPLLQTYQQTQAIRLYYQFYNVSTDRYHLADGYHQVMLSTRELAPELPAQAQTWVNQYLQFTHGYGVVMNFVSDKVGGGFPKYLLENIPAESAYDMKITQPSIYFGATMQGYRIVATRIKEFDYPKGNNNVYTSYAGRGGIPLDSYWKKLLFAWTQGDINILLTSYLGPESRIQIWRTVQERVAQVAPFLQLDEDPYPVLSDGRLYWIQDAYTTSDQFPYSAPHGAGPGTSLNYIRNSVKVVVDMYDGTVRLYVMDPEDPVLAAYRRAFPGAFRDLDQLSPDLHGHLRYPEDLFAIQADQYRTFHMTDPQVFYNREDLWVAPTEQYAGMVGPMQPYYILMKLPGSDDLQYLLMTPFTPQNRDNMISWMAAKSDFPDYGKILFYQLPKERLVYGPAQIEAMIDQNTTISQQLTLWDQRGSRVIRGTLIVTPIENSFLYIVPVYLQAQGTNFPQLKRVIAVTGDKVVMEPTLDEAVNALFGARQPPLEGSPRPPTAAAEPALAAARTQLDEARQAMGRGDWAQFGAAMEKLDHELQGPTVR